LSEYQLQERDNETEAWRDSVSIIYKKESFKSYYISKNMPNNTKDNEDIRFPDNSGDIILELLEKYGLSETPKEEIDKIYKGEKPNGRKVADLLRAAAQEKLSLGKLPFALKKELKISQKKAESLSNDLKSRILDFVGKEEPKPSPASESVGSNKPPSQDIYREPIE